MIHSRPAASRAALLPQHSCRSTSVVGELCVGRNRRRRHDIKGCVGAEHDDRDAGIFDGHGQRAAAGVHRDRLHVWDEHDRYEHYWRGRNVGARRQN